jgi:hypothetical protein
MSAPQTRLRRATESERDPRIDPQAGDILRGAGSDGVSRFVQVHFVRDAWVCYCRVTALDQPEAGSLCRMALEDFCAAARDAEVLSAA